MNHARSEISLAATTYLRTGWQVSPQATWQQQADGAWIATGPVGEWANATAEKPMVWRALASRANDHSPMVCQRTPGGEWRSVTWSQAWSQTRALASALIRRGYGAQRPIATLSGNAIEHALLRFAAMMVGIPLVHLSPAYSLLSKDHAQLRSALALVPCDTVFVQDELSFAAALNTVTAHCGVQQVLSVANTAANHLCLTDLCQETVDEVALATARNAITDDTWCGVYFTSGSTGQPKAVPNTHGMLDSQQRITFARTPPAERRPVVLLDWLPWHHVFAGVANLGRLLTCGGTYYIDEGRPIPGQFEATVRNLRDVAPTAYVSSPVAFARLAAALEQDDALAQHFFSRLESMGYGGASLPADTWQRMQVLAVRYTGHKIQIGCGMGSTETAAAGISLYWASDDTANIGLPLPEVALKLVPLEGQRDLTGRFDLRVKGPQVFKGYIGRPDLNTSAFDADGYYKLGDAVKLIDPADPLRGLRFDGRVAEDFKLSSGTWVRAGAVRLHAIALLTPFVTDAVVCGQDRDTLGILAWPQEAALRALSPELADLPLAALVKHPVVLRTLADRLTQASDQGGSGTLERMALLTTPPSLDAGETTDKGYINQSAALRNRAADVERLYTGTAFDGTVIRVQ